MKLKNLFWSLLLCGGVVLGFVGLMLNFFVPSTGGGFGLFSELLAESESAFLVTITIIAAVAGLVALVAMQVAKMAGGKSKNGGLMVKLLALIAIIAAAAVIICVPIWCGANATDLVLSTITYTAGIGYYLTFAGLLAGGVAGYFINK